MTTNVSNKPELIGFAPIRVIRFLHSCNLCFVFMKFGFFRRHEDATEEATFRPNHIGDTLAKVDLHRG
jgi:hypothetical protein